MLVGDCKLVFPLWTSFSFLLLSLIKFSLKSKADFAALKALPQLRDFSCQVRPSKLLPPLEEVFSRGFGDAQPEHSPCELEHSSTAVGSS